MAKEDKIVKYINYYLLAAMSDKRFAGKKAFGLTETKEKGDKESMPAEIKEGGELVYVGIDDTSPLILYHRSFGSTISADKANSYGRATALIEKSNMGLFVFAQWSKIEMSISEIKDFIIAAIPQRIDAASASAIGITSAFIKEAATNFNSSEIFDREYKVIKKLNPDFLLMEIKYTIECRYNQSCITTNACITPPDVSCILSEN